VAGYAAADGYVRLKFKSVGYPAHRIAWFYHYGVPAPRHIDHINRVRTDNRIANLRLADLNENQWNSTPVARAKGYCYYPARDRFRASVGVRGKRHQSPYFRTAEEASRWYRETSQRLRGEFNATGAAS
jgi:hypothetical protein